MRARVPIVLLSAALLLVGAAPATAASRYQGERPFDTKSSGTEPQARSSAISLRTLRGRLASSMRSAGRYSGAYVYDLDSKRGLYSKRGTRTRILASNTKLFTTAASLERLGARMPITTSVRASGTRQPVTGSATDWKLSGDLYLRGGGDPVFGWPTYHRRYAHGLLTDVRELAAAIADSGLTEVSGALYADDTIFDRLRGVPGSGYALSRWIGPVSGLSWNGGFVGNGQTSFLANPPLTASRELASALRRRGVKVRDAARLRVTPTSAATVADIASPTLAELAGETNRQSDNFVAEMLLKGLGAGTGGDGTTRSGARAARSAAQAIGQSRATLVDGSGLSRGNRAAPAHVVRLLRGMYASDSWEPFRDSLARPGRSGTLNKRMRGTLARNRCRAKTGTLNGASALSGYCKTGSGRHVAFSFLMNGANVYTARRVQDQMASAIAAYR
ncbi:MAG: D-alanyl-D-alanine carboxypeptidase/D-alanyl-D-alanine-endopeptidase [Solirubrobacterales bacterium]